MCTFYGHMQHATLPLAHTALCNTHKTKLANNAAQHVHTSANTANQHLYIYLANDVKCNKHTKHYNFATYATQNTHTLANTATQYPSIGHTLPHATCIQTIFTNKTAQLVHIMATCHSTTFLCNKHTPYPKPRYNMYILSHATDMPPSHMVPIISLMTLQPKYPSLPTLFALSAKPALHKTNPRALPTASPH